MDDKTTALAIMVRVPRYGQRFFAGFGKRGRLLTAWSLAGATLFGPWRRDDVEAVTKRLTAKGYSHVIRLVSVSEGV